MAVQLAGVVEYTNCISAEIYDLPLNKCPGCDIKPSPTLKIWGIWTTPFITIVPWNGSS